MHPSTPSSGPSQALITTMGGDSMSSPVVQKAAKRKYGATWTRMMPTRQAIYEGHAKQCWGAETVAAADQTKNCIRGSYFSNQPSSKKWINYSNLRETWNSKVTYSHRQHTKTEAKFVTSQ
jgi:hypothetical protein